MITLDEQIIYRRNLNLGKVDYNETGRKVNLVQIEIELRRKEKGIELSICGEIWNHIHTDIISGGQNIDTIARLFPHNKKVQRVKEIWKRWHLNDIRAGCAHQRALKWEDVRIPVADLPDNKISNRDERGILAIWVYPKEHKDGLLTKPCPECGYAYGSKWLFEEIPAEVIEEIKSW